MKIPIVKRRVIVYNQLSEVLIFYAKTYGDGPFRKIRVFNFAIFLNSRKFHAREIYMVYSIKLGAIKMPLCFGHFLNNCYVFCTCGNRNKHSTVYILNGMMMS